MESFALPSGAVVVAVSDGWIHLITSDGTLITMKR